MSLQFTANFFKKISQLAALPVKIERLWKNERRIEAERIVKEFRKGILNDSLGLARLKKRTIRRKELQGFKHPTKPLVGKGRGSRRSFANMMEAKKTVKNGYKVAPKNKQHWTGTIELDLLFIYHEDAKRKHTPKRPALQIVLDRTKKNRKKKTVIDKKMEPKLKK